MLTIVDNHGHGYPVAYFFVQREDTAQVADALTRIRQWNPHWKPKVCWLQVWTIPPSKY